jgi:hypothetical protein
MVDICVLHVAENLSKKEREVFKLLLSIRSELLTYKNRSMMRDAGTAMVIKHNFFSQPR